MPELGPELTALQRDVLLHGLPTPESERAQRATEVRAEAVGDLLAWAVEHRLLGLLEAFSRVRLDDVPDTIADAWTGALRQNLAIEAATAQIVDELRGSGIEPTVFKGVAVAHLDYPDAALRVFFDADVLVDRSAFGQAATTLEGLGFSREPGGLGPRWDERFGRALSLRHPVGIEVDLHAQIAAGYFGAVLDHDRLRCEPSTVQLGTTAVSALGADARLLAACFALWLSRGGSLRLLRDIAQLVLVTGADPRAAAALAGEGDVVVAAALEHVDHIVGLGDAGFGESLALDPSRRQRLALRLARRAEVTGWRADAAGQLLGLDIADRFRFVSGAVAGRLRRTR